MNKYVAITLVCADVALQIGGDEECGALAEWAGGYLKQSADLQAASFQTDVTQPENIFSQATEA